MYIERLFSQFIKSLHALKSLAFTSEFRAGETMLNGLCIGL